MHALEDTYSRETLLKALEKVHESIEGAFRSYGLDDFYARPGNKWSPADTLRHLIKSERPIVRAMYIPKFILRLLFGKPDNPSMRFNQIKQRYAKALDEGAQAGRYAPAFFEIPASERDAQKLKARILDDWMKVGSRLHNAVDRWYDYKLDNYRLPHPVLGKLTVREMLLFTICHDLHHLAIVKKRFPQQPQKNDTEGKEPL